VSQGLILSSVVFNISINNMGNGTERTLNKLADDFQSLSHSVDVLYLHHVICLEKFNYYFSKIENPLQDKSTEEKLWRGSSGSRCE